jgi:hypothetical protein
MLESCGLWGKNVDVEQPGWDIKRRFLEIISAPNFNNFSSKKHQLTNLVG